MSDNLDDINIGLVFNHLTIMSFEYKKGKFKYYKCLCDCGNYTTVRIGDVKSGNTKSCGCIRGKSSRTHGMSDTKLYKKWKEMRRRCQNPNREDYINYGGRGISVCKSWDDNFMNFYDWAINNDHREDLEIDRINNDGNYEPSNCRWVTRKEQANNKQQSRYITINGRTQTLKDWSDETQLPYDALRARLNRGWDTKSLLIPLCINQYDEKLIKS